MQALHSTSNRLRFCVALLLPGGIGLAIWGSSLLTHFRALADSSAIDPIQSCLAFVSSLLFSLGLILFLLALASPRQAPLGLPGKLLLIAMGVCLFLSSAAFAYSMYSAHTGFAVIASAASSPRPEELREFVDDGLFTLVFGQIALLVASLLATAVAFFGTSIGQRIDHPDEHGMEADADDIISHETGRRHPLMTTFCWLTILLIIIFPTPWFSAWMQATHLEALLSGTIPPKAYDIAAVNMSILRSGYATAGLLFTIGTLLTLLGIVYPSQRD